MSSFNSVSYSGNTPANTIEHRQRPSSPLPPKDSLFQHAHPQHLHHDQHQRPHQQQQQEAHYPHLQHEYPYSHQQRDICEMQRNVNLLPNAGKKLTLARIEGEDEELEVIGNGINGSFESRSSKSRLLMRLPNLKYNYPEASVQNFSPGTSLIFNAFKGHGGLLTQPYMEDTYESTNDNANRRILNPLSQEADVEQDSRQRVIFEQRGSNSYSPYHHQRTLEHSPYRAPHEHQFHPYQINGHSGELKDHRDYREPRDARGYSDLRERGSPRNRPAQRSPGMASSSATAPPESAGPSAAPIEQGYDSRNRISNHRIAEYHEHLRSRGDFPPFPPSQAPQHTMLDPAHIIAPSHPTQPASQYWDKRNSDLPDAARPYERNNSSGSINSRNPLFQPVPQQRQPVDTWEGPPDHQPPYATPAIDIPLPRNQGSVNYAGDFDHRDSVDSGMQDRQDRQHQFYMQQPQPSMAGGSMGSPGFRAPFSPRTAGPRYSFSRINYRMIFEYASEIRECLIKGKVGTTDRLLYNAEILSKVFMGCRSDVDPNAPAEEETALNPHQLRCTSCNIVKTPEWRKGPLGPRTLCNACGLIWGKMSRNKAALVAKNKLELSLKAEPPANTEDTQMTDATSEDRAGTGFETITVSQALDLPNGPRKRGRDNSSILNSEDAEAAARDEDKQTIEESRREVEALHLTAGGHLEDQKMGFNDDSVPKPSSQGHAGKAVSIMECEAEKNNLHQLHLSTDGRRTVQSARNLNEQGTPVPEGVSCLAADSTGAGNQENQGEDASTEGRKLALSYLLA